MRLPTPSVDWSDEIRQMYEYDKLELFRSPKIRQKPEYRSRYNSRYSHIITTFRKYVFSGADVIDIAAGQGNFSIRLAELGYNVVWNDLREQLVHYVSEKDDQKLLKFCPGNAFEVFSGQSFDAVLATEIIEHVAHPDVFLWRLASLVKPGGFIVMSTPNGATLTNRVPGRRLPRWSDYADPSVLEGDQFKPDSNGHLFLLHEEEIRRFADSLNLQVIAFDYISNPLTVGRFGLSRIQSFMRPDHVDKFEAASRRLPQKIKKFLMECSIIVLQTPK